MRKENFEIIITNIRFLKHFFWAKSNFIKLKLLIDWYWFYKISHTPRQSFAIKVTMANMVSFIFIHEFIISSESFVKSISALYPNDLMSVLSETKVL
jgi:hypothetical protein